jgi:hypothetical protein
MATVKFSVVSALPQFAGIAKISDKQLCSYALKENVDIDFENGETFSPFKRDGSVKAESGMLRDCNKARLGANGNYGRNPGTTGTSTSGSGTSTDKPRTMSGTPRLSRVKGNFSWELGHESDVVLRLTVPSGVTHEAVVDVVSGRVEVKDWRQSLDLFHGSINWLLSKPTEFLKSVAETSGGVRVEKAFTFGNYRSVKETEAEATADIKTAMLKAEDYAGLAEWKAAGYSVKMQQGKSKLDTILAMLPTPTVPPAPASDLLK